MFIIHSLKEHPFILRELFQHLSSMSRVLMIAQITQFSIAIDLWEVFGKLVRDFLSREQHKASKQQEQGKHEEDQYLPDPLLLWVLVEVGVDDVGWFFDHLQINGFLVPHLPYLLVPTDTCDFHADGSLEPFFVAHSDVSFLRYDQFFFVLHDVFLHFHLLLDLLPDHSVSDSITTLSHHFNDILVLELQIDVRDLEWLLLKARHYSWLLLQYLLELSP